MNARFDVTSSQSFNSPGKLSDIEVSLYEHLPEFIPVGGGNFLTVSGECTTAKEHVASIELGINGAWHDTELSPGTTGPVFWGACLLDRKHIGQVIEVTARVTTASGRCVCVELGTIQCRDVNWRPVTPPEGAEAETLVAVCMATYRPDPAAFRRQIYSLRRQTHANWLCIINDDGTPENEWQAMMRLCNGDRRFNLHRNEQNLGFYRNFEKALTRVPEQARYVAFCDQDDYWYDIKLSRLVSELESTDAALVYSDMRIVDAKGDILAESYWTNRRNEYRDLGVVLVANTVTGAASLFKREILSLVVPFPPRVGDAFHDHWLACLALSTGGLAYVDEPLYDYYQYGDSVIGHCDFTRFTLMQRIVSFARFCFRMCHPSVARPLLRAKYTSALAVYRGECRRLRLVGQTIRKRCSLERETERTLSLFDGGLKSIMKLLILHARVLFKRQTTDDAELRLAMGEFARLVEKHRISRVT